MTSSPKVWDGVLRRLGTRVPECSVEAWLAPLAPAWREQADAAEAELVLECPSVFHRDRVRDRFLAAIGEAAREEAGRTVSISLVLGEVGARRRYGASAPPAEPRPVDSRARVQPGAAAAAPAPPRPPAPAPPPAQPALPYTFESFVVGPCNALAREAALAAVRRPTRSLSPLYLTSAPGNGKTHLARAMVNEMPGARVTYTTAEAFTNAFMTSIRGQRMEAFKRRFRDRCDLLVVENLQFLQGKAATQLEFFHTVEHVLDAGGRVVLSADRLPHELADFDERARSRLGSGFVAEIEPPDARVRRSLLRAKAAAGGLRLPADCLDLLVEEVRGSVRDLEGVLIQLVTTSSLLGRPVDLELTRDAIAKKRRGAGVRSRRLGLVDVVKVVAAFHKMRPEQLASRSRRRDVLLPRQLAMVLARRYTDASLAEVGRALGRDHTAVRNAVRTIERSITENAPLRYRVEAIVERLDALAAERRR